MADAMNTMNKSAIISSLLQSVEKPDLSKQSLSTPPVPETSSAKVVQTDTEAPASEDEILDLGNDFDFDGFQVVRREFFAHMHEPSVSFNNCKFYVNTACLQRFPDASSVQVLINQETKIMALMPCPEDAKDSFIWCSNSKGKRKPKQVTCKLFFAKIVDLMNWNPDYRYKLLGKMVRANGETLFDLNATEVYQRTFPEGSKPQTSRVPVFPAEWQNQFGLPYNEHRQYMQINIFDGYAVYSIKESKKQNKDSDAGQPMNKSEESS